MAEPLTADALALEIVQALDHVEGIEQRHVNMIADALRGTREGAIDACVAALEKKASEHRQFADGFRKVGNHNAARIHAGYEQVLHGESDSAVNRLRELKEK